MSRNLTAKQNKFLSALFDEAEGDVVKAKLLAGYSENTSTTEIIRGMVSGVTDPTELGIRDKLNAAKELLDRSGIVKTEKMQVESSGGIMLLPAKDTNE